VALARRCGAPSALGSALHVRALLEVGEQRIAGLRAAVALLEQSPARIAQARALSDLGAALRVAGEPAAARVPLTQALEIAHLTGARPVEERARTELQATGARPRRPVTSGVDSLTASERRVSAMAATGLTNAEVAQELFITAKTVEAHLGRAYRKLGIAGRAQLPAALGLD
jgi:DNA-binding CsgD family transcriptional regulator